MATYTNNLRLKEITTGDEDGTWGTSTNNNLDLIAESLGYSTQDCFSSDGDATTTVADGNTDPARALYFKVTSSATLTATRTLTIAPNTISRVMFIENATTGSQSIAISQGSGANVTVANGSSKLVYLDGVGATAAVIDISTRLSLASTSGSFANLTVTSTGNFSGATISNLGTVTTADINGGTVDGVTIGGASAGAGTFTSLNATNGGSLTGTWSNLGTVTTVDINGGTIDGVTIGGASAGAGTFTTLADQDGSVRTIPSVGTKTSSYTLATSDVGQYVQVGTGGSITIPDATFSEGDVVNIFNNTTGDITITCSITTAYKTGTDADVASVALVTRGLCSIFFISSTVCVIAGAVR